MLEITGNHIARLGDEDLRTLVVMLCEAEIRKAKRPASAVLAGGNQTAKDGGIDVRVGLPAGEANEGLDFIPRPATGFQVKCEDMPQKAIYSEMRPDGTLRDSIKELVALKGAYVIVCSQGTVSDLFLRRRKEAMATAVEGETNATDLHVDFYDRDRLARWTRQYPGVELWVRERIGEQLRGWRPYGPWAGVSPTPYYADKTVRLEFRAAQGPKRVTMAEGADIVRERLREPGGVLRLVGLSGTGKTRFVQALFEAELGTTGPLDTAIVRYTDLGAAPEPNARDMLLHLGSTGQRAIVVVDNCNPITHATLTEIASPYLEHLSLITIEYDVVDDDIPDATEVIRLSPASDSVLRHILEQRAPHLTYADLHFIATISGGNARIALALARTVRQGESLGALNDSVVFQRLFRQNQEHDPALERAAEVCSLVYSFDAGASDQDSELGILASLVQSSGAELYRHVETLRSREIVQCRSRWRALLPPALANRLAKAALRKIQPATIQDHFSRNERLLESFARRISYLEDSDAARAIATAWLSDPKLLGRFAQLNDRGRLLLNYVAPLATEAVLRHLELALSPQGIDEFLSTQGTAFFHWCALARHLAHAPHMFESAAEVLLYLAEIEPGETKHGRDAFREMFRSNLSGTLASVSQRIAFLKLALLRARASERRQELLLGAACAMLEIGQISSAHDFNFGSRSNANGWEPSSLAEATDWVVQALAFLRGIAQSNPNGHTAVRSTLAENFRDLWMVPVRDELRKLMLELAAGPYWPQGWASVRTTIRLDGPNMKGEDLQRLKDLADLLAPTGVLQETVAYLGAPQAGVDISDALDESDAQEDANPLRPWERLQEKSFSLGKAAAPRLSELDQVLPGLHCIGDHRAIAWGRGLAFGCDDAEAPWNVLRTTYLAAGSQRNVAVLQGFLQGVGSRSRTEADRILNKLEEDEDLAEVFPHILGWPSADSDGDRLLRATQKGVASAFSYRVRTAIPGEQGLSAAKFCEVLQAVSTLRDGLAAALGELAFELFHRRSKNLEIPPEELELSRTLLARYSFDLRGSHVATRASEVAKSCLGGPEGRATAAILAGRLAEAMGKYWSPIEHRDLTRVLLELQTEIALDALLLRTGDAEPQSKRRYRSFYVTEPWLHGAPVDAVLKWVAVAPDERAPLAAAWTRLVERLGQKTNVLDYVDDGSPATISTLASGLLDSVCDKKAVLDALRHNFYPTQYFGSLASTLAPFLDVLHTMTQSADTDISTWAAESILLVQRRIEEDRARESLDEERFE
ncbi:MAG: hypothetical protein JSS56_04090 [Proteobacteria bacterium]|nr:hypothetical protein [Pseudomonadota bacterium]